MFGKSTSTSRSSTTRIYSEFVTFTNTSLIITAMGSSLETSPQTASTVQWTSMTISATNIVDLYRQLSICHQIQKVKHHLINWTLKPQYHDSTQQAHHYSHPIN
uniref:Uncharacterized protein n=1 Tax=Romanomermis culicivorax TaxID=13658 RepID=A0A915J972_ROMCU